MMDKIKAYQSYRGLPALAGLASIADAAKPGLSIEACVARLKRYHYAFRRLHEILTAHITAEPIYDLKTGFSLHACLCAEHVQTLRQRVCEMREPPLGQEEVPHAAELAVSIRDQRLRRQQTQLSKRSADRFFEKLSGPVRIGVRALGRLGNNSVNQP